MSEIGDKRAVENWRHVLSTIGAHRHSLPLDSQVCTRTVLIQLHLGTTGYPVHQVHHITGLLKNPTVMYVIRQDTSPIYPAHHQVHLLRSPKISPPLGQLEKYDIKQTRTCDKLTDSRCRSIANPGSPEANLAVQGDGHHAPRHNKTLEFTRVG